MWEHGTGGSYLGSPSSTRCQVALPADHPIRLQELNQMPHPDP